MKKIDVIIIGLLILGGVVSIFLPNVEPHKKIIGQKELLHELNKEGRYITTDEVARMIMEKDPSLILVDVRSPEEYDLFTIDGAINIPVDSILSPSNMVYLDQDAYTTVLFSTGNSLADQAWLTLESYGYEGNRVMKGGLNQWYQTILNPKPPSSTEITREAEKQYLFRKAAQIYFTGIQVSGGTKAQAAKSKPVVQPVKKRKKKPVSGGCG